MKFSRIWNPLAQSLVLAAVLVGSGCNLFNPDGTGDSGNNTESLLIEAQNRFRDAEYTKAFELFQKAVQQDSTLSEGYMGMAKAGMLMRGVNPMVLLKYVNVDSTEIPFMNADNAEKNRFYQGMRLVDSILQPLVIRDSLTALYEAHLQMAKGTVDPSAPQVDPIALEQFRTDFGGSQYAGFPLSDRLVTYPKFSVGYTVAKMVAQLMGFLDLNKDGSIDDSDLNISISKDENGNIQVDLDQLYTQALEDPATVDMLNSQIDDLSSGMTDLSSLIDNLGGGYGLDDSTSNAMTEEIQGSTSEQIAALEGTVQFYKLGDGIDNDGDGCVDEEIYDGLDNDGDGLVDEDLRLVPNSRIPLIDYDQDGLISESDEQPDLTTGVLGFVAGFVANNEGERNSTNKDHKLAIATDTLASAPQYSLEQRQQLVGGCWVFYNNDRFNQWFQNR